MANRPQPTHGPLPRGLRRVVALFALALQLQACASLRPAGIEVLPAEGERGPGVAVITTRSLEEFNVRGPVVRDGFIHAAGDDVCQPGQLRNWQCVEPTPPIALSDVMEVRVYRLDVARTLALPVLFFGVGAAIYSHSGSLN